MFASTLFIAAQVSSSLVSQEATEMLERASTVAEQGIACMDRAVKESLRADIVDANPENVIEHALKKCEEYKSNYKAALRSEYISQVAAENLATEWFDSLRTLYLEQIRKFMRNPQFAESRANLTLLAWKRCVTEKSENWSRLSDDASSVAQAAVGACSSYVPKVKQALEYQLASKDLPEVGAASIVEELDEAMVGVAVQAVISSRAARLAK